MRGIAGRIGYAAGSIYNAVGDLDAVLLRVKAETLLRLSAHLTEAAKVEAATPLDRALFVAQAYVQFVSDNRLLWIVMLEHQPNDGVELPDWFRAAQSAPFETVDRLLEPFFPDPAACRRAGTALWAALEGVAALTVIGSLAMADRTAEPVEIARSIVHRYLTGHDA
eukprot:gene5728-5792_t